MMLRKICARRRLEPIEFGLPDAEEVIMRVSQIMSREVAGRNGEGGDKTGGKLISALAEDSLSKGIRLMQEHKIKHLPVTDGDGKLVGIVTDRDLKRASASDATSLEVHELNYLLDKVKLSEVMTKSPFTVTPATSVQNAARLIAEKKLGCLPVLHHGSLVGIVTTGDFLRCLAARKIA